MHPAMIMLDKLLNTSDNYTEMVETISDPLFGYTYGPIIAVNMNQSLRYQIPMLREKNPIINVFCIAQEILEKCPNMALSELRSKALQIMHAKVNGTLKITCESIGTTLLKRMQDYKYDHHVFESAMVNASPIVPYGESVQPFDPAFNHEINVQPSLDTSAVMKTVNYFIDGLTNIVDAKNDRLIDPVKYLDLMLKDVMFDILKSTQYTMTMTNYDQYTIDGLMLDDELGPQSMLVKFYYLLSFLFYYRKDLNDIIRIFKRYRDKVLDVASPSYTVQEAIQFFKDYPTAPEAFPLLAQEAWEEMSADMMRKIEKLSSYPEDEMDNANTFDINKLTAFIYNARKYQFTQYINSLFLSRNSELELHSFVKDDLVVCQLDNQYLVAPVVDIADNYTAKIIWMDDENHIYISKGLTIADAEKVGVPDHG